MGHYRSYSAERCKGENVFDWGFGGIGRRRSDERWGWHVCWGDRESAFVN